MRRAALFASLACACSVPTGTASDPIIGGTRSTGVTSTVLLASFPPDRSTLATCTAVLVSPTVLVTAAHCVDAANHPSYVFGVFTGDDAAPFPTLAALEPQLAPVAEVHAHPMYSPSPGGVVPFFADIAVAILASPSTIAPAPIQRAPIDDSWAGKTAQIVGYGQTQFEQPNQTRFEATTVVVAVRGDTVVIGDNVHHGCLGDSGGPAFVDGVLVGVDSFGPVGCTGPSSYRRTDAHAAGFLDAFVPPPAGPDAGPTGGDAGGEPAGDGGGCATHRAGGWLALLLGLAFLRRRR